MLWRLDGHCGALDSHFDRAVFSNEALFVSAFDPRLR
jgi:hypothetical protein